MTTTPRTGKAPPLPVDPVMAAHIEHWRRVADGTGKTQGEGQMPLCRVYFGNYADDGTACEGCPIKAAVGLPDCGFKAYGDWRRHQERHHVKVMELQGSKVEPGCTECAKLSKAMVASLEGLQ